MHDRTAAPKPFIVFVFAVLGLAAAFAVPRLLDRHSDGASCNYSGMGSGWGAGRALGGQNNTRRVIRDSGHRAVSNSR